MKIREQRKFFDDDDDDDDDDDNNDDDHNNNNNNNNNNTKNKKQLRRVKLKCPELQKKRVTKNFAIFNNFINSATLLNRDSNTDGFL